MRNRLLFLFAAILAGLIALHNPVAAYAILFVVGALLAPRLAGRLCVNTLGTLATSLIVQRALELVFTKRPELNLIGLDLLNSEYSGAGPSGSPIAQFNQAVKTRVFVPATVEDFGQAATGRADLDVSVTLDKHKQVLHTFTVAEYSGTARNLVDESAEPIAVAIANHMVDAISLLWTVANFANNVPQGAGWDYDHLVAVRKALNQAGCPDVKRYYIANSDVYASLLTDPRIVAAFNNQNNAGAIMTGDLPMVAGLKLAEYPALPADPGTVGNQNLVAFAGYRGTCVMACRVPKDPREVLPNAPFPGNLGIITEPRTGLSVMVSEWIDPATLSCNLRLNWMYGVAKGNETANGSTGRRITTV